MNTLLELVRTTPARAAEIPHSRPTIAADDIEAVARVIETGMIAEGRMCEAFEERLAAYLGTPGVVATGSGAQALQLALLAAGIDPGDRVAVPTYVCRSVLDACWSVGAIPTLVDSGDNYTIDPKLVFDVAARCKAVVVPHILGITADIERIRETGLTIIEDCAQAIGGQFNGRPLGSLGDLAIFSFHAVKILTTGEGGAVTATSAPLVKKLRELKYNRTGNMQQRYVFPLSDLQAALGISQLKRLESFVEMRGRIADRYLAALGGIDAELPFNLRDRTMFYRFPIRVRGTATDLIDRFAEFGVAVRQPVCELLHRLVGEPADNFPKAERHLRHTLGLPIYPSLTETEQERVIDAARTILG